MSRYEKIGRTTEFDGDAARARAIHDQKVADVVAKNFREVGAATPEAKPFKTSLEKQRAALVKADDEIAPLGKKIRAGQFYEVAVEGTTVIVRKGRVRHHEEATLPDARRRARCRPGRPRVRAELLSATAPSAQHGDHVALDELLRLVVHRATLVVVLARDDDDRVEFERERRGGGARAIAVLLRGMRAATLVFCLLVFAPKHAAAWSPGPYSFERCVAEFDVAVRGVVKRVDVVDKKAGGWVLSRATLEVERTYHGITPAPKQLVFYFWSDTDNTFTLAHALAAKDRILVFLSTNLDPVKGMKTDAAVKYVLQFAKANHRGYLYRVTGDKIRDAVFAKDDTLVLSLAAAEQLLTKRASPRQP
jgi:hypothetical protein